MYQLKSICVTLIAATTILAGITAEPHPVVAGTCASSCGPRPIQFTPGQRIRIEVVNRTNKEVKIQKPFITGTVSLKPGGKMLLEHGDGTVDNASLLFWHEKGYAIKATISKPNFATLRVELRPEWRERGDAPAGSHPRGDRAIYILDNGYIQIL
jgi:hypothetical protein